MDIVPNKSQRCKIRNILVRYCGNKTIRNDNLRDKNYQHPENVYLAKYFPKYYQRLALQIKPQNSFESKIKRIKKLKRFFGEFNGRIPRVNWLKILANTRKEIEELPQLNLPHVNRLVWAKITLFAVKFFFKITKLRIPTYNLEKSSSYNFPNIWKPFSKHLRNMRRLKILEIDRHESLVGIGFDMLEELNRMPRLLGKLEVVKCSLRSKTSKAVFSQNKKILPFLTNINYVLSSSELIQRSQTLPQMCKNLKSFSLEFDTSSREDPNADPSQFLDFITPIQNLSQLQSISIGWAASWSNDFWSYFIPPASLRSLKLQFHASNLANVVFKVPVEGVDPTTLGNVNEYENFFGSWKEIKELDILDLEIRCQNGKNMLFTMSFITALLKKIGKLILFQCLMNLTYDKDKIWRCEPFLIKEVPHLYEHLKKLKIRLDLSEGSASFDFGLLKPFKNMKEIDFEGSCCSWRNIWDGVRFLEENLREGEFSLLKLGEVTVNYPEELNDLLKRIFNVKNSKTNFKIMLALKFFTQFGDDEVMCLHQFCEIIEANIIKGLEILLEMKYQDYSHCNIDRVKGLLEKYPGLKNLVLRISMNRKKLEFIKRDGEKEQFLFYP